MKTFCWSAFLLSLFWYQASSQILVGPIAGANYSWTTFANKDLKDSYKMVPTFGFHVGGHLAFKVRNRFFLHTSLLYTTKGREIEGKTDVLLKNFERYSYVDMPITYTVDFRGKIGTNKEFKYFLGIGPNIGYWLGAKGTLYNSDLEENHIEEISYKAVFKESAEEQQQNEMNVEDPNRFQFGLNFVAGLVVEPAPRQRMMLSIRYELGHTYLAKTDGTFLNTYYQSPLRSRNQGFRVSLAYMIDLKVEERKKGKSTIDKKKPR